MANRLTVVAAVTVGILCCAARTDASIMLGDVFRISFTDTGPTALAFLDSDHTQHTLIDPNPDLGTVTSADFKLGPSVGSGLFSIAAVTYPVGAPPFLSVDFTNLTFDANLLGLFGILTDTYL